MIEGRVMTGFSTGQEYGVEAVVGLVGGCG